MFRYLQLFFAYTSKTLPSMPVFLTVMKQCHVKPVVSVSVAFPLFVPLPLAVGQNPDSPAQDVLSWLPAILHLNLHWAENL